MTSHQIIIVDDDADDREMIKDAFLQLSEAKECLCLENGDRLLEYLDGISEQAIPALILLDLNMPGKDGRQTLKEIKGNQTLSMIPTIVFTTSSSPKDRQMSYELGANCFITKPDTFDKLVEVARYITKLWLQ